MTDFKDKIDKLLTKLDEVKNETDEVEQCKKLNKIFGSDFPVPEKKDASKQQMNFIPCNAISHHCWNKKNSNLENGEGKCISRKSI